MKALDGYILMAVCVITEKSSFSCKRNLKVWPLKWKLSMSTFYWYCFCIITGASSFSCIFQCLLSQRRWQLGMEDKCISYEGKIILVSPITPQHLLWDGFGELPTYYYNLTTSQTCGVVSIHRHINVGANLQLSPGAQKKSISKAVTWPRRKRAPGTRQQEI